MVRRKMAHRIGGPRIPGQRKGLAAAAAEILLAPRTAPARLRASSPAEGRNAGESSRCPQGHGRERSRTRAGNNSAAWHGSTLPAGVTLSDRRPQPPTQGFGKTRIVVRHHRVDNDFAAMLGAQHLDLTHRLIDLLACRHQRGAIFQGPAIILHMRRSPRGWRRETAPAPPFGRMRQYWRDARPY